ncbi:uncharacterized protein Dvar_50340 [Desulfosarcina variabilis str. Montpellier]
MGDVLQEKMPSQTVKNDIVAFQMGEQGRSKESHKAFLARGKAIQDRRGVMDGSNQLQFHCLETEDRFHR